jgi:hypothetical protein
MAAAGTARLCRLRSKHLKLIAYRIPEANIKRSLLAFGLHRLLCLPTETLADADGPDSVDHQLRWIRRNNTTLVLSQFGAWRAHRAIALRKYGQASQNPVARRAGQLSAGRRETAIHSPPPRRADNHPGSPRHTPDTSTANRPSTFSLHGRSRIDTRPCGLPFGENGMGREKRNRCPGAGQRA